MSNHIHDDGASGFAFGKLLVVIAHFIVVVILSFVLADLVFSWVADVSYQQFGNVVLIWLVFGASLIWLLAGIARFFSLFAAYGAYFDGDSNLVADQSTVNTIMTITVLLLVVYVMIHFLSEGNTEQGNVAKVEQLTSSLADIGSDNEAMRGQLAGLDNRVTQVGLAVENMSLEGNALGEEVAAQRHSILARIQDLETQLSGRIQESAKQSDQLNASLAELVQSSEEISVGLRAAMHDQSGISEQVSQLIAGIDDLDLRDEQLLERTTTLAAELEMLRTDKAALLSGVETLAARTDKVEQELGRMAAKVKAHEARTHQAQASEITAEQQFFSADGKVAIPGGVLHGLSFTFDNARLSASGDIVGGVEPKPEHLQSLGRLVSLAAECASADSPVKLAILGFASARPFRRDGEVLAESDALNLATANKRAQSIYSALTPMAADLGQAIELELISHPSLEDMAALRPYEEDTQGFSDKTREALSRSVLVQLSDVGSC